MKWKNGDVYIGEFHNDMMHGHGKAIWTGGQVSVGIWEDDKQAGFVGATTRSPGDPDPGEGVVPDLYRCDPPRGGGAIPISRFCDSAILPLYLGQHAIFRQKSLFFFLAQK